MFNHRTQLQHRFCFGQENKIVPPALGPQVILNTDGHSMLPLARHCSPEKDIRSSLALGIIVDISCLTKIYYFLDRKQNPCCSLEGPWDLAQKRSVLLRVVICYLVFLSFKIKSKIPANIDAQRISRST